ncbi:MAG TPA: hypothetical protein DEW74_00460 [Opitutae bacterium]|nr:hypothetical protein [Opitutae bacterium]
MHNFVKNIIKSIQPLRRVVNYIRINRNLNAIASYPITNYKIKSFIRFLNNYYPDLHINYLDIGASGGLEDSRIPLFKYFNNKTLHGIECDEELANELKSTYGYDKVFTKFVGIKNGSETAYILNWKVCSSIKEPNIEEFKRMDPNWVQWITLDKTISIETETLSHICGSTCSYDWMKLDTEATEYEVLTSLPQSWFDRLQAIDIHTMSISTHKTNSDISDILTFMKQKDFYPLKYHFYPLYAEMDCVCNIMFVKGPWNIYCLEDVLKHCLMGMLQKKPYYVSYILNRYTSLFPNDQAFRSILRFV